MRARGDFGDCIRDRFLECTGMRDGQRGMRLALDGPKPLYFVASDKEFRWRPSHEPRESQVRRRHRAWDQPALPSWVMPSLVYQLDDGEGGVGWLMR
jgi:hypothetical protein